MMRRPHPRRSGMIRAEDHSSLSSALNASVCVAPWLTSFVPARVDALTIWHRSGGPSSRKLAACRDMLSISYSARAPVHGHSCRSPNDSVLERMDSPRSTCKHAQVSDERDADMLYSTDLEELGRVAQRVCRHLLLYALDFVSA